MNGRIDGWMFGGGVGGWINIWMGDFNMWFTYM